MSVVDNCSGIQSTHAKCSLGIMHCIPKREGEGGGVNVSETSFRLRNGNLKGNAGTVISRMRCASDGEMPGAAQTGSDGKCCFSTFVMRDGTAESGIELARCESRKIGPDLGISVSAVHVGQENRAPPILCPSSGLPALF